MLRKDFLKYIKFYIKSKADPKEMFRTLIEQNQIAWAKKYLQTHDSAKGNCEMFRHYWSILQRDLALSFLEKNKENQHLRWDQEMSSQGNYEEVKARINKQGNPDQFRELSLRINEEICAKKGFLDAVDHLLKEKSFGQLVDYLNKNEQEM